MKAGFILFDRSLKILQGHRACSLAQAAQIPSIPPGYDLDRLPTGRKCRMGDLGEEAFKSMGIARVWVGKSFFTPNGRLGGESKSPFKILYDFEPDSKTNTNRHIMLLHVVSMRIGGVLSFGTLIALLNLSFPPFVKILNENVFQGIPGP